MSTTILQAGPNTPIATPEDVAQVVADLRYRIADAGYDSERDVYTLADRCVNNITPMPGQPDIIDIELPVSVEEPTGVRRARDFIIDVDNRKRYSESYTLEFTALGVDYAFLTDADERIGEMMTIGPDDEYVRFYFTESSFSWSEPVGKPVFHVARVTLGDFVTSTTPATQGGN